VLLGSSLGEDAALVRLDKRVIVLKTDPVTATTSDAGWLSVHLNANDIACRGAKPRWFLCDLLMPEHTSIKMIEGIMQQIDQAARRLHVAIVGGHTEVTPYLRRPIVVGYMVGLLNPRQKAITSSGAMPGDDIIMTKTAGIEGTTLLAMDFADKLRRAGIGKQIERARSMRHSISIVNDAMTAVRAGGVHAMHDPTEGGLLQGVWEIGEASKVGFTLHESRISITSVTEKICTALRVDPLRLMSSGCLLIAADKRKSSRMLHLLRKQGIQANVIGEFTKNEENRRLVKSDGTRLAIGPSERDELYRVIETHSSNV
jgi:hydrogenase maturation factor